jgi:hypothetical protein
LLPQRLIKLFAGGSETRFARAEAFGQNRRDVVVDDVHRGKIDAECSDTLGVFRNHYVYRCAWSHGARPLGVEVCFHFVTARTVRALDAGIGAIQNDVVAGEVGGESEQGAELLDVGDV